MEIGFTKTVLVTELGQALGIEGLRVKEGSPLYAFVDRTAGEFVSISKENATLRARVAKLEDALRRISLGSQNSMTTKESLGKEARAALEDK